MPLGIFNKVANKGAISIELKIKGKNFIFLNCHLEAHEENRRERLEQWHQVYQRFICKKNDKPKEIVQLGCCDDASGAMDPRKKHNFYTFGKIKQAKMIPAKNWDGVIWMGDFNSRIDGFRYGDPLTLEIKTNFMSTLRAIQLSHYNGLFERDQLNRDVLHAKNDYFNPFREGHTACFAPTFKIKPGLEKIKKGETHETYNIKRLPSYTDRILFWSTNSCHEKERERILNEYNIDKVKTQIFSKLQQHILQKFMKFEKEKCEWFENPLRNYDTLQLVNYDSNNLLKFSDHRPVFAQFMVMLDDVN